MIRSAVAAGQRDPRGRLLAWSALVLVLGALGFASRFVGGTDTGGTPVFFQWSFGIGGLIQYALMLGIVLWIASGLRRRETFALRRPRSIARGVGIALATLVVVGLVSGLTQPFLHERQKQGILPAHWVHGHVGAFVLSVIAVAVAAPIVEELTFRGLGFRLLDERYGRRAAIVLVGIAFGIAHGIPEALPVLIPFGSGLAYLRARTQSVFPGMVVHSLFNAVAVIAQVV